MRDKLIEMLWELNDHVYADYDAKADEILSLFNVSKRLNEDTLEEINTVMWESYMIKDRNFGRQEGFKIMQELEKWAKR